MNDESDSGLGRPLLSTDDMQHPTTRGEQHQLDDLEEPLSPPTDSSSASAEIRRRRHGVRRLLDRDAAFYQSRGRWRVRHVSRGETRLLHTPEGHRRRQGISKRFWNDWFHALAYTKTIQLIIILFLVYTTIVFVFAFIYLYVSLSGQTSKVNEDGSTETQLFCDMEIHDHMEALYFSLSTMTSTGYGVSNYYFSGCWTPFFLVLLQVCSAITFDAVAIGLLFTRISRGHKRSKTILFSDKAVVRRVRGVQYLYIRLAELRHYHLLEAKVRAYCIRHERVVVDPTDTTTIETTHFVTKPLHFQHEQQQVGSHIMMSLPQVVVHRLDGDSPLVPPSPWYSERGQQHAGIHRPSAAAVLSSSSLPSSSSLNSKHVQQFAKETEDLECFLRDREAEIVVLLEGIDELTGSVIQTRHSYTYEDIAWNQRFAPCVDRLEDVVQSGSTTGGRRLVGGRRLLRGRSPPACVVDFARFHETLPAPEDSPSCPYIS